MEDCKGEWEGFHVEGILAHESALGNSLDLLSVDGQVSGGQGVPTRGIQGAKPGVRKSGGSF